MEFILTNTRNGEPKKIIITEEDILTKFRHCLLDDMEFGGHYDEKTNIFEYDYFHQEVATVHINFSDKPDWHTHPHNTMVACFPSIADIGSNCRRSNGTSFLFVLSGVWVFESKKQHALEPTNKILRHQHALINEAQRQQVRTKERVSIQQMMDKLCVSLNIMFKKSELKMTFFEYPKEILSDYQEFIYNDFYHKEIMKPYHIYAIENVDYPIHYGFALENSNNKRIQPANVSWKMIYTVLYDITTKKELIIDISKIYKNVNNLFEPDLPDNLDNNKQYYKIRNLLNKKMFFISEEDYHSLNRNNYNVVISDNQLLTLFKIETCFHTISERFFITSLQECYDKDYMIFDGKKVKILFPQDIIIKPAFRIYFRFMLDDIHYYSIYSNPDTVIKIDNRQIAVVNNHDFDDNILKLGERLVLINCKNSDGKFTEQSMKLVDGKPKFYFIPSGNVYFIHNYNFHDFNIYPIKYSYFYKNRNKSFMFSINDLHIKLTNEHASFYQNTYVVLKKVEQYFEVDKILDKYEYEKFRGYSKYSVKNYNPVELI